MENTVAFSSQHLVPQPENPWLEAASEVQTNNGRLLKFVKGTWESGDDTLPEGTEFVAYVDQIARGWIKFEDGRVTQQIIGKIADGFKLPLREDLSDTDPAKWEKDADGDPRDPWVKQWFLPLINIETDELQTFVTGSKGGEAAVANLCRVYGRKQPQGLLPIVALRTRTYKHKQFGRIADLVITGWDGSPTAMPVHTGKAADAFDDNVPF